MKKRVERLRGMYDLLPEGYQQQSWITNHLHTFLAQAGYVPVDAPLLEQSDLFLNSFGQELWQNLYTFRIHNHDLCLRPEYTASICRLYLDHYQQQPLPLRFQYAGPVFRYEAPGRSRYRQHTQLGIELFGGHSAPADAEILQLACEALHNLNIQQYRLELGHIGVVSGFINRLHLDDHAARLLLSLMEQISRSEEGERIAQARLETLYPANASLIDQPEASPNGPNGTESLELRSQFIGSLLSGISISFDDTARQEVVERFLWKMERNEQRRQILRALEFLRALHAVSGPPPAVFDALHELLGRYELNPAPLAELQQLVAIVEQAGVPRDSILLNLSLGRGVSYYTGMVFEVHATDDDGFDTQICGGGRYDRLMRIVGSTRDVKACGFTFGVERLLSLLPTNTLPMPEVVQALVIPVNPQDMPYALHVAHSVRASGMPAELDVTQRGVSGGLKLAAKKHIRLALIVGDTEQQSNAVTVHDLSTGEEYLLDLENVEQILEHTLSDRIKKDEAASL